MKFIFIDGNIGAGKSFLIKYIQKHLKNESFNYVIINENITKKEEGIRLLNKYYDDRNNSFEMNMWILKDLKNEIIKVLERSKHEKIDLVIFDRSPIANLEVFSKMNYDEKYMKKEEYQLLSDEYLRIKEIIEKFENSQLFYFYINTNIKRCIENSKERDRKCENNIDEKFLKTVEFYHKHIREYSENIEFNYDIGIMMNKILNKIK